MRTGALWRLRRRRCGRRRRRDVLAPPRPVRGERRRGRPQPRERGRGAAGAGPATRSGSPTSATRSA